ncbi:MAG: SET domain-containing protein [Candidatus Tectimicrobiota bacterium]
MSIRVRIHPSPIAGQGLFAAQDIRRGTKIIQYTGEKISKAESARRLAAGNAYIFEFNQHYDIDGEGLENTARYINHSCDPNCTVEQTSRTLWVIALRYIKAGEELTYNYGYSAKKYRCSCGAPQCCGYILDEEYW